MSQSKDQQKVYSTLQKFWCVLEQKGRTMHEGIKTLTGNADMTKEQSWVWLAEVYDAAHPGSGMTEAVVAMKKQTQQRMARRNASYGNSPRRSTLSHQTDEQRRDALHHLCGIEV